MMKYLDILAKNTEIQSELIDEREIEPEKMIDTANRRETYYEEPIYEKEIDILAVRKIFVLNSDFQHLFCFMVFFMIRV